ncbi:hypothetical protein G9A89_023873 [Geosiphon pyriformis]|nr:hypothetical protein G9A89_023873 [Geosiphon pyriformis]
MLHQAALDVCKLELGIVYPDFKNCCWIKHQHIVNIIRKKNLRVSWHKVQGYLDVMGNKHADALADTAFLSLWCLVLCVKECYILADGNVVSDNSRHFVYEVFQSIYHAYWKVSLGSRVLDGSLHSDVDWFSLSLVWHPDLHMAAGFTSKFTADAHAIAWDLFSGLSAFFSGVSQFLSSCASNVAVCTALYKGFVFKNWLQKAVSVFEDAKIAGQKVVEFVHNLCLVFKDEVWLVCAKHHVCMEKSGMIPSDSLALVSVSRLSALFSVGVVKLLGITKTIDVGFSFHKSCLFFSGVRNSVLVHISV